MKNTVLRALSLALMFVGCDVDPSSKNAPFEIVGFGQVDAGDMRSPDAASDQGVVDQGLVDQGVVDQGVVDQSAVDQSAVDQGAVDRGAVDRGAVDRGAVDQTVVDQGVVDQTVDQGPACVPVDEACNAADDDCDGQADEGLVDCCSSPDVVASPDLCDGIDNDCDGRLDEEGGGDPCQTGEPGRCADGVVRCADGQAWCAPRNATPELCDAIDNDCDGVRDEGFRRGENCSLPVCGTGFFVCAEDGTAICGSISRSQPEQCDGIDNDCDRAVDEDFNAGEPCALPGRCGAGLVECSPLGEPICDAIDRRLAEVCNGIDDDCDGEIDEAIPPTPELCDAIDNDCDGRIDEDAMGVGAACATGFGACRRPEVLDCVDGALICDALMGEPGPEVLNDADDDCDGRVDEELLGAECDGGCGQGLLGCADGLAGCDALVCLAPAEMCADGLDNDCDAATDEQSGVRRLPPRYTDVIVHEETLIAWGGTRIGRFTIDGRALAIAEFEGLGAIQGVAPTDAGLGVFGQVDRGDARALTFVHLDAQLRPASEPTLWLQAPTNCGFMLWKETAFLDAIAVPDGVLVFYTDSCRPPFASLSAQKLDLTGQPLHAPTVVRQETCGVADFDNDFGGFDLCPVRTGRAGDTVWALTNGPWAWFHDAEQFFALPILLTLNTDGEVLAEARLRQQRASNGLMYEAIWSFALGVVDGEPLIATAKSPANTCNALESYVTALAPDENPVLLNAALPDEPTQRAVRSTVVGQSLVTAWVQDGAVAVSAVQPQPVTISTPKSVVAGLDAGERLVAISSLPDDRLILITAADERLGARIVGWPACAGQDQDCDGVVDEGCADAACPAGSAWYRPGGYWSPLAGDDPSARPAITLSRQVSQTFDACGRVTGSRRNGRSLEIICGQQFSEISTFTTHGYDADGSLTVEEILSETEFAVRRYFRTITHTHDADGLRTQTNTTQDCEWAGFQGAEREDCEIYGFLALRMTYTNDARGRLVREEADFHPPWVRNQAGEPDGVDRISTFTWDDAAGVVIEDVDHDANGEPDERLVHPIL